MSPTVYSQQTYRCTHCGCTFTRASRKAWVKSFCTRVGRTVHLLRVKR